MVAAFRAQRTRSTPVVLMGYANPIERYDGVHGKGAFIRDAARGRRGRRCWWSTTRPRSARTSLPACAQQGMDPIFLLAPTSTDARMAQGGASRAAATSTTCRSRA